MQAPGHDWEETEVTADPTCTDAGEMLCTCAVCGETKTEEIAALGHTWDDGTVTIDPDCTTDGEATYTCTVCGAKDTVTIPAAGHQYETEIVDPTCTTDRYTSHRCSVCGYIYYNNFVQAPGHTEVKDPAVDPTCTETGLTEGSHCSVCEEVLTAQEEIAALGHDWDDGVVTADPTCTEDGELTYTCGLCGESYTETIPAAGHDYVTEIVDPTCTEDGYTAHVCKNCGYTYKDTYTDALGHTEVTDIAVEPTCTENGLTEGSHCEVCDAVLVAQEEIAALGHEWEDGVVTVEATCTEDGYITCTCSLCGDVDTVTIKALGHDWDDGVVTLEEDCTEDGEITYTCSLCGETTTETIPAAGHNYVDTVVEPTDTEDGYTSHVCQDCGYVYTNNYVPALGSTESADSDGEPAGYEDHTTGDVNGDGEVNILDVQDLLQYVNGRDVFVIHSALDVNRNGRADISDVQLLLKYVNKQDVVIY